MNVVKTPMSTYVLYGLAVLFLCIATFEIFTCYGDIRTLIETKNFVLSENYAYVISYYIEHCATYFGISFLLYATGVISMKLNETHVMLCQMQKKN